MIAFMQAIRGWFETWQNDLRAWYSIRHKAFPDVGTALKKDYPGTLKTPREIAGINT